jgi:hypothetical protein
MHQQHASLPADVHDERATRVDRFIASSSCSHFMQSRAWLTAFADSRESVGHLVTWADDGSVSGCSGLRRVRGRGLAGEKCFIDGGPVFDDPTQLESHIGGLLEATREASYVRIRPYLFAHEGQRLRELLDEHGFHMLPAEQQSGYATTLVLDLARASDSLYAAFSTGLKRNLRRAARTGVVIEPVSAGAQIGEFAELLRRASAVAGYDVPPAERVTRYLTSILSAETPAGALFCARVNGTMRAGVAVLRAGTSVVYQWGARSDPGAQGDVPLTHALHWEAINWARSQGFRRYDFGGMSAGPTPTGIDRFKEAFGGERQQMFGEAVCARGLLEQVMSTRAGRFVGRLRAAAARSATRTVSHAQAH